MRMLSRSGFILYLSGLAALLGLSPVEVRAGYILSTYGSGTPDGSWAYSKSEGVGRGNSSTYMPIRADWASAVFQGYVHSSSVGSWNTIGAGTHDEDTISVFRTFIRSEQDVVIPLRFAGDDGHSLYINDGFIGGGGFGAVVHFDLSLTAGAPMKIEFGVYNGPGPMGIELQRRDTLGKVESTPGVMLNAEGAFQVVPEPATVILAGVGVVGFASWALRRRSQHLQSSVPD